MQISAAEALVVSRADAKATFRTPQHPPLQQQQQKPPHYTQQSIEQQKAQAPQM